MSSPSHGAPPDDLDAADAYGRSFADVYDQWYGTRPGTDACVDRLAHWAGGGPVAELGVGTGRLAVPLATRGLEVVGVDGSAAMLERLVQRAGSHPVRPHLGDMAEGPPPVPGGYAVVFVAFNTLFNLTDAARQVQCFRMVSERLAPNGRFVVEAFVPRSDGGADGRERVRTTPEGEVWSVWTHDRRTQVIEGRHEVEGRPDLPARPWRVRYATPDQLDEMAAAAGLVAEHRWAGWSGEPFDDDAHTHVSTWVRPAASHP